MTAAARLLRERLGDEAQPRVGLVLGSGLGGVADDLADAHAIPYAELPGFPVGTVGGHAGRLVLGTLAGVRVAVLQGRAHLYEGIEPAAVREPIRTLARARRAERAADERRRLAAPGGRPRPPDGAHRPHQPHGRQPARGPNDDDVGPRFPSLLDAYDPALRALLHEAAAAAAVELAEGVYLAVTGPTFETPAEIRAFRTLGADAVGMSTVPETIVARHAGLRVAAVSVITNLAEGLSDVPLSHDQTLDAAAGAAADLRRLVHAALPRIAAAT